MEQGGHTLAGISLFAGLGGAELERLAGRCHWRSYEARQQIIGHQDPSNDVYFIVTGTVRAVIYSLAGKEVSFRDLDAGMSFGELAAIDGKPRSANVVALTDALVAAMAADVFRKALHDYPEVSERLLRQLVGFVRELSERVFEFSALAVRNRIHAELLRLARRHGGDGRVVISPAPTHADIASRVSTHREAVTRELNALARDGVIERARGALVIPDVARLARMVEEVTGEEA